MGTGIICFFAAIGAGAWIYNKLMKSTGGRKDESLTVAGIAAGVIFIGLFLVLSVVLPS